MSKANARWKILANFIKGRKDDEQTNTVSVRRILNFGFLVVDDNCPTACASTKETDTRVRHYTLPHGQRVYLRLQASQVPRLSDIAEATEEGCDTTGLIAVWPAEEALAYFCTEHAFLWSGKRILEIGCGAALAGLVAAVVCDASCVHLTDGNSGVVQLAEANIAANSIRASEVKAFVLPWKEVPASIGRYDVILAADCLYFEKAHAGLLELLDSSLTVGGVAYFVCPPRGKSLHVFMDNLRRHSSGYAMDMHVAGWNSHIDAVIATVRAKQPELFDDNIHSLCILTVERLS